MKEESILQKEKNKTKNKKEPQKGGGGDPCRHPVGLTPTASS